jgi:hypothetical protein
MGAITSYLNVKANSAKEAFKDAVNDAEREYGQDIYNGQINTCCLTKDVTSEYHNASNKNKFISEMLDNVPKREAYVVCLKKPVSNTNKIKSVVNVTPQKGARQWVTVYKVYRRDELIAECKSQTEAIKKARAFSEKHQCKTTIEISKKLSKGIKNVAEVEYKNSRNEQSGEYLFMYCASC